MPRHSPLVSSVARLRRPYTGEPAWAVEPEVGGALADLTPVELSHLLGHLPGPVPDRVRRLVLPDTLDSAQQSFEAAVFDAAATLSRPVFWMVQPRPDQIRLSLMPDVAAELVQALYARVPGLVSRPIGMHVFLSHGPATVVLAGVGTERWTALMDDFSALASPSSPPALAPLLSSLLRRSCLFPLPPRVVSGELRWQDGPTTEWISAALAHPVAGLSFAQPLKLVSESPVTGAFPRRPAAPGPRRPGR
ncbi:hypothetical protein [Kutzneria sp. CA-103260]|uniref:hypothetical protein n=1 Tax=Kutzneria sp. CA-103260 TaxID=2802641 RepID=UPI001BABCFF9|nr:hypothetical protein [Kutzneria sp. CA-103260]QUQ67904.1 hypothetical protein JJ691_56420 [Kutzneria sp. CA-103260]